MLCVGLVLAFGEAEAGEDDGDGGECHGGATGDWGEVAEGGEWDADDVVDECPEEVLADGGHGLAGEGEGSADGTEVVCGEGDGGGFDGDVGAAADGDADVS